MTELATIHEWPNAGASGTGRGHGGLGGRRSGRRDGHRRPCSARMPHELLATFDDDDLIDFRARRPTLRIVNGVDTELRWATIRLMVATNRTGPQCPDPRPGRNRTCAGMRS